VPIRLAPFGDAAIRAVLPRGIDHRALLDVLRALPGVVDAVVSEEQALVTFDPANPPDDVRGAIERAMSAPQSFGTVRRHLVRVRYDGPDIEDVARAAGMRRDDVLALHVEAVYVVAAIGFLPGFAYLRGLDTRLIVPRRTTPRPRVPAMSVAVAGPYSGVYPFASPGGWNILGTAIGFAAFDPQSGATLALGDEVRFEKVTS